MLSPSHERANKGTHEEDAKIVLGEFAPDFVRVSLPLRPHLSSRGNKRKLE